MSKKLIISQGSDRYGAHFIRSLIDYMYFKDEEMYFSKKFKYYNRVFFTPFKLLCKYCEDVPEKTLHPENKHGFVGHVITVLKKLSQDIPSYFQENYKESFLSIIESKLNNIRLVWNTPEKILCIHLRLDDEANYIPKYENLYKKSKIVLDHVNSGFTNELKSERIPEEGPTLWIRQHNVNLNKLEKIINQIHKKYNDHQVHIIASPKGNVIFPNSFSKYKIHRNLDEDSSLWHMINSDVLVLSSSVFALTSGLFHKGQKVYYPLWNHFAAFGLNTIYDKSNWSMFDVEKGVIY